MLAKKEYGIYHYESHVKKTLIINYYDYKIYVLSNILDLKSEDGISNVVFNLMRILNTIWI